QPPAFLEELGKNMQEWGVKPEIEAFRPRHDSPTPPTT
ncbi:hypothetical protein HMPREF9460_03906, partial [Flavonifractor plautii 1_3_50AFAA]